MDVGKMSEICSSPSIDASLLNAENPTVTPAAKHPAFSLLDRQRLETWQRPHRGSNQFLNVGVEKGCAAGRVVRNVSDRGLAFQ